jgi:hypothetical protein
MCMAESKRQFAPVLFIAKPLVVMGYVKGTSFTKLKAHSLHL